MVHLGGMGRPRRDRINYWFLQLSPSRRAFLSLFLSLSLALCVRTSPSFYLVLLRGTERRLTRAKRGEQDKVNALLPLTLLSFLLFFVVLSLFLYLGLVSRHVPSFPIATLPVPNFPRRRGLTVDFSPR